MRKTRIMRQGGRQCAAGLTINRHANIPRDEYDRLKATLCNCVRRGPDSQNTAGVPEFRSHLEGRVAYVESVNPLRGTRLRDLLSPDQLARRLTFQQMPIVQRRSRKTCTMSHVSIHE